MGIRDEQRKMKRRRQRRIVYTVLAVILAVLVLIGLIFGIRALVSGISGLLNREEEQEQEEEEELTDDLDEEPDVDTTVVEVKKMTLSTADDAAEGEPVTITASFMGDCTLGRDENMAYAMSLNAYYDNYGPDYFFQNVRSVLEADDLSVVNLEGTLTTETNRQYKTYAFKGDPSYVEILTGSSVEAANTANNHSYDYGDQSHVDTMDTLEEAGIAAFGFETATLVEVKGVQIGLAGIYGLNTYEEAETSTLKCMDALKEAGAQIIIASYHWGIEREYWPSEDQVNLAHLAIDCGADLVIGHHPHVLEGIEKYKGKYIAYSLGNFCFGGNSNPSDKDSMILQETFTVQTDGTVDVSQVEVIPCSVSSSGSQNDYCPTLLTGDEAQRVLDKIATYSEGLSTRPDASTGRGQTTADTETPGSETAGTETPNSETADSETEGTDINLDNPVEE